MSKEECVIHLRPGARIRCPAYPEDCTYVAIDIDEIEVGYWDIAEWTQEPAEVMGAIMGVLAVALSGVKTVVVKV